jgi:hypothetical protein
LRVSKLSKHLQAIKESSIITMAKSNKIILKISRLLPKILAE